LWAALTLLTCRFLRVHKMFHDDDTDWYEQTFDQVVIVAFDKLYKNRFLYPRDKKLSGFPTEKMWTGKLILLFRVSFDTRSLSQTGFKNSPKMSLTNRLLYLILILDLCLLQKMQLKMAFMCW
jgi:hypothetical protein